MNPRKHFARFSFVIICLFGSFSHAFSQNQTTPAQDLARKITAANSETERNELIEQNKELQTVDLRKALLAEALRLRVASDYEKARTMDEFTLKFAERISDGLGAAAAINGIGVDYQEQGQYVIARQYFNESLTRKIPLKDQIGIASSTNNIGLGYSYMGDYSRAQEFLQKALKILEDAKRPDLMPNPLNNLGIVQRRLGNLPQAQSYYKESLRLYEAAKNKYGASLALSNLAVLKLNAGDYAAAVELNRKSLALREELGDKNGVSISLNNLGNVYLQQNDFPKALEYYEKQLKITEEVKARDSSATALSSIAEVKLKMQQPAEALNFAARAVGIAREIGGEELLWKNSEVQGKAYRLLKQPENARQSFDAAIKIIESRRFGLSSGAGTQNYLADKLQPYQEVIGMLVEQNDATNALDYAEHAKARTLLDILSGEPVEIGNAMTGDEKTRESEINNKIGTLNRQILIERARQPQADAARLKQLEGDLEKARLDYEAFRASLYAAHPELQAQRGEAKIISPAEIAESLLKKPNEALLEYVVAADATYAFVITRPKTARAKSPIEINVHKIQISQTDLTAQTESFRQAIASRGEYEKPGRALYDLLVAPVERELKGKTKIVVVPDGTLWNLPFQTLQTKRNRFLLEDYILSYAPSLTALREMRKISRKRAANTPDKNTLLAFGNPVFEAPNAETKANPALVLRAGDALAPLPDAEREVQSLRDLYGARRSVIYVEKEAREDRAKAEAGRFKVLQFATHGVFNDANPLYSYLILSPDAQKGGDDGLLEARELMNLNLSADLVVLSACETARGRVSSGEGMIGMTWALFVAGVPSTVASQWKVSSAGTTQIMLDFHRNLLNKSKQSDKAAALRAAELGFLRKGTFRHPFYWAGFVLIGND